MSKIIAVRLSWNEYERGWGSKHWGYTLHLNREDAEQFVKTYWASHPDEVPDWYVGPATATPVYISKDLHDKLLAQKSDLSGNTHGGFGLHHNSTDGVTLKD